MIDFFFIYTLLKGQKSEQILASVTSDCNFDEPTGPESQRGAHGRGTLFTFEKLRLELTKLCDGLF